MAQSECVLTIGLSIRKKVKEKYPILVVEEFLDELFGFQVFF
jgi:hypothetical protein